MVRQFNKINSTNIPWIESPFFYSILKTKKISLDQKKKAKEMHEKGYCIIDLKIKNEFIDKINFEINQKLQLGNIKKNPSIYHYNNSPRIVEAWKFSKNVARLALNSKILSWLRFFYNKTPIAFSTLNFLKGTEQPLHSDYMHFSTTPQKYLAGVWVALEDAGKYNGPLAVVPGSHKLELIDYTTMNLKVPDSINSLERCYRKYEQYVRELILEKKMKCKQIHVKKGQAIIWAANLLHGGTKMKKKNLTRKSQVMHYHFEGCEKFYNPGFSNLNTGDFKERVLERIRV